MRLWPAIDEPKLKPPLSTSHSIKAISSHQCSFVDEARRDKRLDTFQMTVSTVITNKTLKQNPMYVSLIKADAHLQQPCLGVALRPLEQRQQQRRHLRAQAGRARRRHARPVVELARETVEHLKREYRFTRRSITDSRVDRERYRSRLCRPRAPPPRWARSRACTRDGRAPEKGSVEGIYR